jgi:hypothetical protein
MPRAVRVDRGDASARLGEPPGSCRALSGREAGNQLDPDGLDHLVEEGPDVPTALVERVEERDAGRRHRGRGDRRTPRSLPRRQAREVADLRLVDALMGGRQQLVEHRFGVAHPAGGESGDQVDGRIVRFASVGLEDPSQLALDLGDGEPADVEPLEPGQDRRREPDGSVEAT